MYYDSVGRFTIDKANKMLQLLCQQIPHIHWELEFRDGLSGDVDHYANICVPEFQLDEAEYLIGRLENGDDLSDYQPGKRFPILFTRINGDFKVVKPVALFAENVRDLIQLLDRQPADDMGAYLRKISQLLLNIYSLQTHLPECTGGSYYQPWLGFSLTYKFESLPYYYEVSNPFDDHLETRCLEKTLEQILEVLQSGLVYYETYQETDNHKYLFLAVSLWKNQYPGVFGWGTAVINALKVLHYAETYLNNQEAPELQTGS